MQKNEAEKFVTIIVPSRTQDYILDECILNIRNLYKYVKIIVILDEDNGKIYDKNVKILKSENRNMSAKRNLGVKNADTKYIALIDSDAYPCQNWIENSVDFLEKNENYSAVTGLQYNLPKDNFIQKCLRIVRYSRIFTHGRWNIINDNNAIEQDVNEFSSANVILTKASYENINGMNEDIYLAEDNEFSLRYVKSGYKVKFSKKIAVFHQESKMYPFLRKFYCMSYYYSDKLRQGKTVKPFKQVVLGLVPLFGIIFYLFLWCFFIFLKINPYLLLIIPLAVLLLLIIEAFNLTKQLQKRKILGFFVFLYTFCAFFIIWILGSFLGLIPLEFTKVENLYKQY